MRDRKNVVDLHVERNIREDPSLYVPIEAMRRAQADLDDCIDTLDNRLEGECDAEEYYMTLMFLLKSKIEQLHFREVAREQSQNG